MDNKIKRFINDIQDTEDKLKRIRKILNYSHGDSVACLGEVKISVGFQDEYSVFIEQEIAIDMFTSLEQHYSSRLEELTKAVDLDALENLIVEK